RGDKARYRLEEDPGGDKEEAEAVGEGGKDLEAMIAVAAPGIGRARVEAEGEPGERERGSIGEHMPRIGEQSEGTRREATGDLQDEIATGQPHHEEKPPLAVRGYGRRMIMRLPRPVVVSIAVGMKMRHILCFTLLPQSKHMSVSAALQPPRCAGRKRSLK